MSIAKDSTPARAGVRKTYKLYIGGKHARPDSGYSRAVVAPDGDITVNNTPVPPHSAGMLDAGHRTLGLKNRSENIAHVLILGGQPA